MEIITQKSLLLAMNDATGVYHSYIIVIVIGKMNTHTLLCCSHIGNTVTV